MPTCNRALKWSTLPMQSIILHMRYYPCRKECCPFLTTKRYSANSSVSTIPILNNETRGKARIVSSPNSLNVINDVSGIEHINTPSKRFSVTTRWKPLQEPTLHMVPGLCKELSKSRLSVLVVLTAMAGYAMAPGSTTVGVLIATAAGTGLCSAAANTINQVIEVPYDAQMSRTRGRVLVRKALAPHHAITFATLSGITGISTLYFAVNPTTAILGAMNIVLYAGAYTSLKRRSIVNTWLGALVGAIPPIMGWAACTGSVALIGPDGTLATGAAGGWLLAGILYSWQFPHFNSLAHGLRADYSKAGYRMMAVTNPALNRRVSLRHSIALVPMCTLLPALGLTSWWFAIDSTILNAWLIHDAYKFWNREEDRNTGDTTDKRAKKLFFTSLVYLPLLLVLMMIHKQGVDWMWYINHGKSVKENQIEQKET